MNSNAPGNDLTVHNPSPPDSELRPIVPDATVAIRSSVIITAAVTEDVETAEAPVPLDTAALAATLCIFFAWFVMNTLVTDFGGVKLKFHFYNLWALAQNPSRLATGLGSGDAWFGLGFGIICLASLFAVFLRHRVKRSSAWLAYSSPLLLMLLCLIALYYGTSGDFVTDNGRLGSFGSHLVAMTNRAADSMSHAVARHIHIGLGGYLAFAASAYLAWRGWTRYRQATPGRGLAKSV